MKFEINEKTFKAISESTGALFIKEVICTSWKGVSRGLWSGVLKAEHQNLKNYNEYKYQGIKIYIEKCLEARDTVRIEAGPKFLFFNPPFTVHGVY